MNVTCTPTMCRCPYAHDQFQDQVIELAHTLGWAHLHVRRTIGRHRQWVTSTSRAGWPDLWLWHPRHGFVAIEIKTGRDKATPEQVTVLAELAAAGARTMVAYPHDIDAVIALLRPSPKS